MAEFALPKNSRPTKGRHTPAPAGATKVRTFKVYRYDPEGGASGYRTDTVFGDASRLPPPDES